MKTRRVDQLLSVVLLGALSGAHADQLKLNVAPSPSSVYRCMWSEGYTCAPAPADFPSGFHNQSDCEAKCVPPSPTPDPLQRWLHDQVFELPRLQLLNKSGITIAASLTCTGLNIGSIKTDRTSASNLQIYLYEIQADCAGPFEASLLGISGTGTVALSILPASYLGLKDITLRGVPPTSVDLECGGSALKVAGPTFTGGAISSLLNAEQGAIDNLIAGLLPGLVCPTLKDLAAGSLTKTIADLSKNLESRTPAPAAPIPNATADTLELSTWPWVRVIEWAVDSVIGAPAPPAAPGINWLMNQLTKDTGHYELNVSSVLNLLKVQLAPIEIAVPFTGKNLSISIDSVALDGLDTVNQLELLKSGLRSISSIDGSGHLGRLQAVIKASVRSVDSDGSVSQTSLPVQLGFNAAQLMFHYGAILDISKSKSATFDIWQILDMNCLAPALNNVMIDSAVLNATLKNWIVSTESKNGIDDLLIKVLTLVSDHYWTTVTNALDGTISYPLLGLVNFAIDALIAKGKNSGVPCGDGIKDPIAIDSNDYRAIGSLGATLGVSIGSGAAVLLVVYIAGVIIRRKRETQKDEDGTLILDKKAWRSLASIAAPAPGLYLRSTVLQVLIPTLIFTITLFRVFSLSTTIETVKLRLEVDGQVLLEELLINFSFGQLVDDFFKAGAWLASIIIIVGTAILPVINILAMCCLWWLPAPAHLRGKALFLLLQSSKLCFVDAFFVSLLTYVFHADLPLGPAVGKLVAAPILGIYLGITGNVIQKLTVSYLLNLHREFHPSVREDANPKAAEDTDDEDVESHPQTVATTKGGGTHVRLSVTATTTSNIIAASVLLIVWASWILTAVPDLAEFRWGGIGGALQKDKRRVDLFTVVTDLRKSTTVTDGANYLITLHLLLVVITPILDMIAWTVIWFVPVPMKIHRWCGHVAEHSFSWHGVDILFVTLFAGWLEIDQIAKFLIEDNFGAVADASSNLLGINVIEINTSWEWGAYPLIVCSVFSAVMFNLTYGQETVRQKLCNAERKRLRGLRRAEQDPGDVQRGAAAAAAYDSDESVSESERSTVPVRVAAQYLCTVQ